MILLKKNVFLYRTSSGRTLTNSEEKAKEIKVKYIESLTPWKTAEIQGMKMLWKFMKCCIALLISALNRCMGMGRGMGTAHNS